MVGCCASRTFSRPKIYSTRLIRNALPVRTFRITNGEVVAYAGSCDRNAPSFAVALNWGMGSIPERFTGIAIFGAVGTGKTSGCMYPFAEQILDYRAGDAEKKLGGPRPGSERRLLPQDQRDSGNAP